MKAFPETNTLFVFPKSVEVLEERLRGRGTETEETLKTRLANSVSEIEQGLSGEDDIIGYRIVNSNLDEASSGFVHLMESLYG